MLERSLPAGLENSVGIVEALTKLFVECKKRHPESFELQMPFGHGMFAGMSGVEDLRRLWHGRIKHLLRRPQVPEHPFAKDIDDLYPWK